MSTNEKDLQSKASILENIERIKEEIAEITAKIKQLEEIPKKKLSPIFMRLIYAFSISSVGLFFLKPIFYIASFSCLFVVIAIAVIFKITQKSKEKKRDKQLMQLKISENRLISELNTAKSKLSTINAALDSQNN